jgi:hypothetical protein
MQKRLDLPYRSKAGLNFNYIDDENFESFYSCMAYFYLPKVKKLEDGLYMIE